MGFIGGLVMSAIKRDRGVKDWGWRRSIRHLRRNGFNAIVPNMLWAGLAHYPSDVLPVSPKVAEKGDQIAQCLRWCKRYGIELHVWKVNYNLSTAPKDFVDKMRAEGRLQGHRNGSELKWLCPSDPRNFALERDSMLEVVRKYGVHGRPLPYMYRIVAPHLFSSWSLIVRLSICLISQLRGISCVGRCVSPAAEKPKLALEATPSAKEYV